MKNRLLLIEFGNGENCGGSAAVERHFGQNRTLTQKLEGPLHFTFLSNWEKEHSENKVGVSGILPLSELPYEITASK